MSRMAEIINRAMLTKSMRIVSTVYETDDYKIFREMENNRDVTVGRREKLIASFSAKEILNPIVVNEKMEIVDGQGRYEALKVLGRPIKFVVAYGATIDDCRRMNEYNTKWTEMTFVKSYASSGNENYERLLECRNKTEFSLSLIARLANKGKMVHIRKDGKIVANKNTINSGDFIFTKQDYENVVGFKKIVNDIQEALELKGKLGETFIRTLKVITELQNWYPNGVKYDHERMVKKCKACRRRFVKASKMEDLLKEFSEVYNYRCSANQSIYLEDYMRNKGYNIRDYDDIVIGGQKEMESAKTLKQGE